MTIFQPSDLVGAEVLHVVPSKRNKEEIEMILLRTNNHILAEVCLTPGDKKTAIYAVKPSF
ncbi:hypothetical protein [Methanogenium cariaci]|jgi:hypothetical protein|uniref:hypothetical protein n=1 Tax=Methanogenium cariaci TaxID=2197 RepID=UPI001C463C72|nr:hypothetical protein [Methanogenium cariaci]